MNVFCLILIIILGQVFTTPVYADRLTSPTFDVHMSTINITGGSKSSSSYKVTDTVGQTAQGQFDSTGYTIKAGFQYIYPLTPFTFRISNLELNYGSLVLGTPSMLSNTLYVTTGSAFGYVVKAVEDHPLRLQDNTTTIPDTSCDLALTCTFTDATPWTDNSRYGFGYNMQGNDVNTSDFVDATYYKPFPIQNINQPEIVMSRNSSATDSAATVTYKVNVGSSQAAGIYQNNIQYIAVPSY